MANVKLKSIKFPDLSDTYVVPSTAGDLTYSEDEIYSDGTVGKAIQATTASLEDYAKVDGSYESMTVGNAEQIVSNVRENDRTPYVFRTSGGSVDIGDREYINSITGGSVAFNQLYEKHTIYSFQSGDSTNVSVSIDSNGLISVSGTPTERTLIVFTPARNLPANHVGLFLCDGYSGFAWGRSGFSSVSREGFIIKHTADFTVGCRVDLVANTTYNIQNIRFMAIDLTQMFGSTIADYIYSLEQATAGAGVAWFKKLFPKPYYPYNSGELMHVSGLVSHDTVGFNAWDEEWEVGGISTTGGNVTDNSRIRSKNYIPVIPNTSYYFGGFSTGELRPVYYDANKDFVGAGYWVSASANNPQTTPTNCYYMRFVMGTSYGTTYNHDICINLSWDGSRNGEYEPYIKHSYPLDSDLVLRGIPKLDANNNLYYDGDIYESDGTVTRKYGIVDLGTLNWQYDSTNGFFYYLANSSAVIHITVNSAFVCAKYAYGGYKTDAEMASVGAGVYSHGGYVYIKDSAYTDAVTFKTAMSGVYLVYELATPTTETADPYQSPQIVDDFGTEEFNNSIVPVGHDTDYPVNLVAKLEMAPNSPDGDGTYVVKQTNGQNEYVPLIIPSGIPSVPTTDGTYKLTVTVTNGTPVLSWEA